MRMAEKILFRGAEANIKIYERKKWILKDREKKSYRLKELDERIRKTRTKSEMKLLEKAGKIVPVPEPIFSGSHDPFRITMPVIKGKKISDNLDGFGEKRQEEIAEKIGINVAKLHDAGIIHGDLTTSNMIFDEKGKKVYFIDFGLGFFSKKIEDRAVDIYLLKEALKSRHFKNWKFLFNKVKDGYEASKNSKEVLERFRKVESRGRYKEKY